MRRKPGVRVPGSRQASITSRWLAKAGLGVDRVRVLEELLC